MKPSLYRRLLASLSLLFVVSIAAAIGLTVHSARTTIDNDYDTRLITGSHMVMMFVHDELVETGTLDNSDLDPSALSFNTGEAAALRDFGRWRAVRIWKDGKIVAQSDAAQGFTFGAAPEGFSNATQGKTQWRIYAVNLPSEDIIVETMENLHNREFLVRSIVGEMLAPAVALLPALALLLLIAIHYGLRGVRDMTGQLVARAPDDLAPLTVPNLPIELQPLHTALNTLLQRLEVSLANEREFIDNAAHELRTPLAALRLQGQLVADTASADVLLATIDRTTALFNQLLTLSRMQHQRAAPEPANIASLVSAAMADRAIVAADKDIDVTLDGDEKLEIITQPEMFKILLGVLLDNAIKYTGAGGKIAIEYTAQSLSITDNGPGIADAEKQKVFARFYRVRSDGTQGSGLGLAIAQQACQFLGYGIKLEDAAGGQGLRVVIVFDNTIQHINA